MAVPSFVSKTDLSGVAGGDLTVDFAGYAVGDWVGVAIVSSDTIVPPTAWTSDGHGVVVHNTNQAGSRRCFAYRVKQSGDTSFVFGINGIGNSNGVHVGFRDAEEWEVVEGILEAGSATDLTFPAVTIDGATSVSVLFAAWGSGNTTITTPSTGYTELEATNNSVWLAWDNTVSAGSLTPGDATLAAARTNRQTWHVELEHVVVTGTAAQTLPALSQSASGDVLVDGSAANTLSALAQAAAGDLRVDGAVAQTLAALTQAAEGSVTLDVVGAAASTLPSLSQNAVGELLVVGDIAVVLPSLTQAAEGSVTLDVIGSAASVLPLVAQAALADVLVQGDAVSALAGLTAALSGSVGVQGDVTSTLAPLAQNASGTASIDGAIASSLPALEQSLFGILEVSLAQVALSVALVNKASLEAEPVGKVSLSV